MLIKPVFCDHLSYVTIIQRSLGKGDVRQVLLYISYNIHCQRMLEILPPVVEDFPILILPPVLDSVYLVLYYVNAT